MQLTCATMGCICKFENGIIVNSCVREYDFNINCPGFFDRIKFELVAAKLFSLARTLKI